MRGIVCEEIGKFVIREALPEPVVQASYAIVQIQRIGICGTDYHAYQGNQPYFTYPRMLGHELAGTIVQLAHNESSSISVSEADNESIARNQPEASEQQSLAVGDQVSIIPYMHCGKCRACLLGKSNCCQFMQVLGVHLDGGMRERIAVPISHLIKTNGLSLDQAVLLEPLAIGAHAIRRSGLQAGQTALVIGAGPIGLGIMALIQSMGAKAIAMDVNEERLQFARSWAEAAHTVNVLQQPEQQLAQLTAGQFTDVVFDATGNAGSMMNAFQYTAHGGILVYVGLFKGDITFHDPDFHRKELTLMGSRNATREDFYTVLQAIAAGHIAADQYITHRSSFNTMPEHFNNWLLPQSKVIKAVVEL